METTDRSLIQTAPVTATELYSPSTDQIDLIRRTIAKGATKDELDLFLYQCKRTGLDPLAKQIYFSKYKNKKDNSEQITIITAIDGYRLIADRTGKYCGNDDPVFDNEEKPRKASVTVYKMVNGLRCPFTASARWDQYYPGEYKGFMWNKMPHLMLGKCAEALALRKAFPNELGGLYIQEEMHQAGEPIQYTVPPTAPSAPPPPSQTPSPASAPITPVEAKDAYPIDHMITFGKFKGMNVNQIARGELTKYLDWILNETRKSGKSLSPWAQDIMDKIDSLSPRQPPMPEGPPPGIFEDVPF